MNPLRHALSAQPTGTIGVPCATAATLRLPSHSIVVAEVEPEH